MKFCFTLLLLVIPFSVSAKLDKAAIQLDLSKGNVSAQIDLIEEKIKTEQYEEMTGLERSKLQSEFLYVESKNIDMAEAIISQDKINKILTTVFDNSELVCKYEAVMGSNFKRKQCETRLAKEEKLKQVQLSTKRGYIPQNGAPLEIP